MQCAHRKIALIWIESIQKLGSIRQLDIEWFFCSYFDAFRSWYVQFRNETFFHAIDLLGKSIMSRFFNNLFIFSHILYKMNEDNHEPLYVLQIWVSKILNGIELIQYS